ncbi:hypothetical protein HRI_002377100 [Hibiscus trionum]|uniref:DUF674 family protein n=1 Tax=Hibiscus trionum TaxID=183268 RepID=A0A9W7M420_HIBTR|nr:hypothetical protein HRI_002377100 [Hibiscus trionum]
MAAAAAATTTTSTMRLKLLIDREGKRVVCAEADKDFVDFLFNILLLPFGAVTRLLTKEAMVGCLGNLYRTVENLDKESLLKPKHSPQGLYRCSHLHNGYAYGPCSLESGDVGVKEVVVLLKASMQSKIVLTDVFLTQNAGEIDASSIV